MTGRMTIFVIAALAAMALGAGMHLIGAPDVVVWLAVALTASVIVLFLTGRPTEDRATSTSASVPPQASMEADAFMAHPGPALIIDDQQRVSAANHGARRFFGDVTTGDRLSTVIRAPDIQDAVSASLQDGHDRDLLFTHRSARRERPMLARIRRVTGDESDGVVIVFEDQSHAAQVEAMRETFIADASHELKTPLASIIGFIETLQGPAKDDVTARDRFLSIMAGQADRMRRLIDDLMSLNRIALNVNDQPQEIVNLGALAHETGAAMAAAAQLADVKIDIQTSIEAPLVPGDRDQLSQLLTNLIDNAIKYGGSKGVVTVSIAPSQAERPGMIGLAVADNGPGIPREKIPRLTERFYRVDEARSRAVGGTGLGLAIAKHILQRHRGDLSIASRQGEGSTFTIWLPATSEIR